MGFPLYPISVTAGANKIPKSGAGGTIATGYIPDLSGTYLAIAAAAAAYQALTGRNAANGYAGLNASAVVDRAQGGLGGAYGALFGLESGVDNTGYAEIYQLIQAPGGVAGVDVDLTAIPSGKRAVVAYNNFNANLTPVTYIFQLKIGSTYYRTHSAAGTSVASLGTSVLSESRVFASDELPSLHIVGTSLVLTQVTVAGGTVTYTGTITGGGTNAYAGKVVIIAGFTNSGNNLTFTCTGSTTTTLVGTTTTQVNETHSGSAVEQTGLTITGPLGLFDDTSSLRSPRLAALTFVAGYQTLYLCPANKIAVIAPSTFWGTPSNGLVNMSNQSGSTATYELHLVKSGHSPDVTTRVAFNNTVSNNVVVNFSLMAMLSAGDSLVVKTDQTGQQMFWTTLQELPV